MKLSKSLLKAIAIGVTIASTTACVETLQDIEPVEEGQTVDKPTNDGTITHWDDCPACGMG